MTERTRMDSAYGRRGGHITRGKPETVIPRPCIACGEPTVQARARHSSCDPTTPLAGKRCTCPPGCTTGNVWGDGPVECVDQRGVPCEPCTLMAGRPAP